MYPIITLSIIAKHSWFLFHSTECILNRHWVFFFSLVKLAVKGKVEWSSLLPKWLLFFDIKAEQKQTQGQHKQEIDTYSIRRYFNDASTISFFSF